MQNSLQWQISTGETPSVCSKERASINITYTNGARAAVIKIIHDIARDVSPDRADDVTRDIKATLKELCTNPTAGAMVRPSSHENARFTHLMRFDGYIIHYIHTDDSLIVTDFIVSWAAGA